MRWFGEWLEARRRRKEQERFQRAEQERREARCRSMMTQVYEYELKLDLRQVHNAGTTEEIKAWLFELERDGVGVRKLDGTHALGVSFKSRNDALMFKLTWGGNL